MQPLEEYQLDDSKEIPNVIEYKWSNKTKILIGLLISISIISIAGLIILIIDLKKSKEDRDDYKKEIGQIKLEKDKLLKENKELIDKIQNNMFIFSNITYADENNPIKNTFKKGGENYIEELGEINNGLDYEYTDQNIYDLYIPYTAAQKKDKYNKVMIYIHGGAWMGGDKAFSGDVEFCKNITKLGFITASVDYTFLDIDRYKHSNIYRIVDEIITVVKNIKNYLKNGGFDENKLELSLIGGSAGAHLALLYSYLITESSIPNKFVINIVGPVTLEPQYFLKIKDTEKPLDNIEQEDIDRAKSESKLEKLDLMYVVAYLNAWVGVNKSANFTDMFDFVTNEVKTDNEIYKERLEKAKYAFPINHVKKDSIPTLCIYGGRDHDVGICQYSLLKSYFTLKENKNIELIYSKNSIHNMYEDPPEIKVNLFEEIYSRLLNYSDKYFSKDN